jgi:hypothetical protein
MAPWYLAASMAVLAHKDPAGQSLAFMLVISSADVPGVL